MKQITIDIEKMQKELEDQIAAQEYIPTKVFMQTVYDALMEYMDKCQIQKERKHDDA